MSLHSMLSVHLPTPALALSMLTGDMCLALQIQVQLQELLLQFCSAEVFTPPTKVCEPLLHPQCLPALLGQAP